MNEMSSSSEKRLPSGSWLSILGSGLVLLSLSGPWLSFCGSPIMGYQLLGAPFTGDELGMIIGGVVWSAVVGSLGAFVLAIRNVRRESDGARLMTWLKWLCAVLVGGPAFAFFVFVALSSNSTWAIVIPFAAAVVWGWLAWGFRREPTSMNLAALVLSFLIGPFLGFLADGLSSSDEPLLWGLWLWLAGSGLIVSGTIANSVPPPQSSPAQ